MSKSLLITTKQNSNFKSDKEINFSEATLESATEFYNLLDEYDDFIVTDIVNIMNMVDVDKLYKDVLLQIIFAVKFLNANTYNIEKLSVMEKEIPGIMSFFNKIGIYNDKLLICFTSEDIDKLNTRFNADTELTIKNHVNNKYKKLNKDLDLRSLAIIHYTQELDVLYLV